MSPLVVPNNASLQCTLIKFFFFITPKNPNFQCFFLPQGWGKKKQWWCKKKQWKFDSVFFCISAPSCTASLVTYVKSHVNA